MISVLETPKEFQTSNRRSMGSECSSDSDVDKVLLMNSCLLLSRPSIIGLNHQVELLEIQEPQSKDECH